MVRSHSVRNNPPPLPPCSLAVGDRVRVISSVWLRTLEIPPDHSPILQTSIAGDLGQVLAITPRPWYHLVMIELPEAPGRPRFEMFEEELQLLGEPRPRPMVQGDLFASP